MMMTHVVARRDGTEAQQDAWDRLLTQVVDYHHADESGRRDIASAIYLRGTEEFGDEQWEHASDYVMQPSVRYVGSPGYVGGQQ